MNYCIYTSLAYIIKLKYYNNISYYIIEYVNYIIIYMYHIFDKYD